MGYTPILYIKRSSLEKHEKQIVTSSNTKVTPSTVFAYLILTKALGNDISDTSVLNEVDISYVDFPEIKLIIINVDLTEKNRSIRKLLDTLGVEYRVCY